MTRRVAPLCAVVSLATALSAQQPSVPPLPDVTFTVAVNYVEVDAVVTDARGVTVKDLRADEFQLLEDGKPQTISAFSFVDVPLERQSHPLFASAPIDPDVFTNTATEGRLYLIVLDDLHTAASRTARCAR